LGISYAAKKSFHGKKIKSVKNLSKNICVYCSFISTNRRA